MNAIDNSDLPPLERNVGNATAANATEKAARKPRPKLDFDRLLKGSKGFSYLRAHTQFTLESKISGKPGREADDLSELVTFLQEWAKLVFPKMTLTEFLKKVEDLCEKRLMKEYLTEINKNPNEDGQDFLARRLEREAEEAVKKALGGTESPIGKQPENDFDLNQILSTKAPKFKKEVKKRKAADTESADEDDGPIVTSEDDSDDFGSDLDDFINDRSDEEDATMDIEEEDEAISSEGETFFEFQPRARTSQEGEQSKKSKRMESGAKAQKQNYPLSQDLIKSDEDDGGFEMPVISEHKRAGVIESDEETAQVKPKSNAIIYSDDE